MQLHRLTIRRDYQGSLSGEIEVAGKTGKVALLVNEALCQRLVAACADELVAVAKTVACDLTAELIVVTKQEALT